jgi:hypothetical protein
VPEKSPLHRTRSGYGAETLGRGNTEFFYFSSMLWRLFRSVVDVVLVIIILKGIGLLGYLKPGSVKMSETTDRNREYFE